MENIGEYVPKESFERDLSEIYSAYGYSDMCETMAVIRDIEVMREYQIIFSVYVSYRTCVDFRRNLQKCRKPIVYNKYLSTTIISIGNKKVLSGISDMNGMYYALYRYIMEEDPRYLIYFKTMEIKVIRLLSRFYSHFYKYKISNKMIKKIQETNVSVL